jgi:signal transduction histidine kinase
MNQRGRLVYGVLLAVWALILVWQFGEHARVSRVAKVALINRAKDISTTLGVVLRSQRRFGVIPRDRLESALTELTNPEELKSVAMLNAVGEVVASAGVPIDFALTGLVPTGEHWGERTVALMNLVDLGMNMTAAEFETTNPPIVIPPWDRSATNRPPSITRSANDRESDRDRDRGRDRSRNDDEHEPPPGHPPPTLGGPGPDGNPAPPPPRSRGGRSRGEGRMPFGRPFWMSEEEYREAIQKQGIHSLVLVLSTAGMKEAVARDLWTRLFISLLATVSVVGFGIAWRNLSKTSELEVRLVRAAELNTHLKEMNFAAAGLAHETKNPLNIIRGLAQMISKQDSASEEIRQKSRGIVDEADRVTAQVNDFINYSRPREVRRANVPLNSAVAEVVRALGHDLEDKAIKMAVAENLPVIETDEQLLRQALFNLLLNATQAVERGGEINVSASRNSATEATLEIRDNGPGVPPENRTDIFKPYFTTTQKGTGLGLAVVQQIVLAHGWEIECAANEPRGAVFRISHLKTVVSN